MSTFGLEGGDHNGATLPVYFLEVAEIELDFLIELILALGLIGGVAVLVFTLHRFDFKFHGGHLQVVRAEGRHQLEVFEGSVELSLLSQRSSTFL